MKPFAVGDRVIWCGVEGVVTEVDMDYYEDGEPAFEDGEPVFVNFRLNTHSSSRCFTRDGKLEPWHKEPSLFHVEEKTAPESKEVYKEQDYKDLLDPELPINKIESTGKIGLTHDQPNQKIAIDKPKAPEDRMNDAVSIGINAALKYLEDSQKFDAELGNLLDEPKTPEPCRSTDAESPQMGRPSDFKLTGDHFVDAIRYSVGVDWAKPKTRKIEHWEHVCLTEDGHLVNVPSEISDWKKSYHWTLTDVSRWIHLRSTLVATYEIPEE